MKLSELASKAAPIAFKILKVEDHEKRPGYYKVTGVLENGDETFIVSCDDEWAKLPKDETGNIVNLSGFAIVKTNRIGKTYVERIHELPPLPGKSGGFANPFVKK